MAFCFFLSGVQPEKITSPLTFLPIGCAHYSSLVIRSFCPARWDWEHSGLRKWLCELCDVIRTMISPFQLILTDIKLWNLADRSQLPDIMRIFHQAHRWSWGALRWCSWALRTRTSPAFRRRDEQISFITTRGSSVQSTYITNLQMFMNTVS